LLIVLGMFVLGPLIRILWPNDSTALAAGMSAWLAAISLTAVVLHLWDADGWIGPKRSNSGTVGRGRANGISR